MSIRAKVKPSLRLVAAMALACCNPHPMTRSGADAGSPEPPSCPECDPHARCEQADGAVTCTCRSGLAGDGHTCADIDECAQGMDPCDHQHGACANTEGSYACICGPGWFRGRDEVTCMDDLTAIQVSVGSRTTCAMKMDGTLACWGKDDLRQELPPTGTFQEVSVGCEPA